MHRRYSGRKTIDTHAKSYNCTTIQLGCVAVICVDGAMYPDVCFAFELRVYLDIQFHQIAHVCTLQA